jgi:mRNA-degrading endonuclease RelE of RelBE toxin-antitoxin system
MDKISKLLQKITKSERALLLNLIERLMAGDKTLRFIKLKNSDLYRLRHGKFRIIFHREDVIIIDSIKLRNDNTYKNL